MKKILLIGSGELAMEFKKSVNIKWIFFIRKEQILKEIKLNGSSLKCLHSLSNGTDPFVILNMLNMEITSDVKNENDSLVLEKYNSDIVNYAKYKNLPIINIFNSFNFEKGLFFDLEKKNKASEKFYLTYQKSINIETEYIYSPEDKESLIKEIEFTISSEDETFLVNRRSINMIDISEVSVFLKEIIENIYKESVQFQNEKSVSFGSHVLKSEKDTDIEDLFNTIATSYNKVKNRPCLTKLIIQS